MIGMLSIDSGQYRNNEDFWIIETHAVVGYKLEQGRRRYRDDEAGYFACNALMPFSNQ